MTYLLWTLQVLLAALFLFGGVVKLMMSAEELAAASPMPALFLHFISVCEVLGGLGLVLPGLLKIKTALTPLAAAGLTIIMIGAVVSTAIFMGLAMAIMPLVIGILTAFVAYGRTRLVPLRDRSPRPLTGPA